MNSDPYGLFFKETGYREQGTGDRKQETGDQEGRKKGSPVASAIGFLGDLKAIRLPGQGLV
jgi:hypothetical protein